MFGFGKKVLDGNLAKELVERNKDKIRGNYDTITLEGAEILATFKGYEIQLYLKTLNPVTARELAKYEGGKIHLYLKTLDSETAKELAKYEGSYSNGGICGLHLSLSNWTEEIIQGLTEFKGNLWLHGLKNIDRKLSKSLITFHGNGIVLCDLDDLKEDVADKLAESKTKKLRLIMNYKKISVETAESLSRFKGEELRLERIENIVDLEESIAKELANFGGKHLILYGIKKIENRNVAKELANFKGEFLHLEHSTLLTIEAFKELNECKGFQNWLDKCI